MRAAALDELEHPDHTPAPLLHRKLSDTVQAGGAAVTANLEALFATAEALRKIAGDSELVLYRYRDLAIEIGGLYEDIRGAREWQRPGAS